MEDIKITKMHEIQNKKDNINEHNGTNQVFVHQDRENPYNNAWEKKP